LENSAKENYMRRKQSLLCVLSLSVLGLLLSASSALSQEAAPPQGAGRMQGPDDGRSRPIFGKIIAIKDGALELTRPDGNSMTVKITGKTEYRKEQQSAKLADFKVGDMVFIRAEGTADAGFTAMLVATRTGNGPSGPGRGGPGGQGGGMMMMGGGELGKDFVFGEVKSVDAPKITVLRPDNVTQTLELNEETSLHKGRESVTMADIQPGDHVFIRGGVENNAFVPKMVMVIGPEQWKRMQEMGMLPQAGKPPADSKPNPQQQ
jgi:preprotein translocase subunit YajC